MFTAALKTLALLLAFKRGVRVLFIHSRVCPRVLRSLSGSSPVITLLNADQTEVLPQKHCVEQHIKERFAITVEGNKCKTVSM